LNVVAPSIFKMVVSSFYDWILRTQISLITFPRIQNLQILNECQASVDADMMMVLILIDFFPPRFKTNSKISFIYFQRIFPIHLHTHIIWILLHTSDKTLIKHFYIYKVQAWQQNSFTEVIDCSLFCCNSVYYTS